MSRGLVWRTCRFLIKATGIALALAAVGTAVLYYSVRDKVPDISHLKDFKPLATTRVFDRSGTLIASYQDPRIRLWIPVQDVPRDVVDALTSAEDPNFFTHHGVDYEAVWEAVKIDLQNTAYVRGASTITQQLMKNLFLTREKTLTRKMKELVLSTSVERFLTKKQILEQYINQVQWGENLYGIEAASRFYFGKPCKDLRMHEGALLAGMLPNPVYFNPYVRLQRLRARQRIILKLMWQYHHITKPEYLEAVNRPIVLASTTSRPYPLSSLRARYIAEPVGYRLIMRETLEDYLGPYMLWQGGLTLSTTLDAETMRQAEKLLGRPYKLVDWRFAVLRSGTSIVAFGPAPTDNPEFEKWVTSRSLTCDIVRTHLPWEEMIVTPSTESAKGTR